HTAHCLASGEIMLSMLGDAEGSGRGGFLLLNPDFSVKGRWEQPRQEVRYNYDFWYQPRHNLMVSTEFAAPNTYLSGVNPKDVEAGKYGSRLYFWDFKERRQTATVELGPTGRIPLEVRFCHDPDSPHGFVGAALSSSIQHVTRENNTWRAQPVVQVEPVKA